MQSYIKRAIEKAIDWAIPALCAAVLVAWRHIPPEATHYIPVAIVGVTGLYGISISMRNRNDIKRLRAIHEAADAREEAARAKEESYASAFRAMLDDDMGTIYAACVLRGYTTEDERRRYDRLQKAYEGVGGNGEAKRRKTHFDALPDEETWKAMKANHR